MSRLRAGQLWLCDRRRAAFDPYIVIYVIADVRGALLTFLAHKRYSDGYRISWRATVPIGGFAMGLKLLCEGKT